MDVVRGPFVSILSVKLFSPPLPLRSLTWGNLMVSLLLKVVAYVGIHLAISAPTGLFTRNEVRRKS